MPKQPKPAAKPSKKSERKTPQELASVDLGELSGVTGGCGGHHRRHCGQQQQPYGDPYGGGYPGYGYPMPPYGYPPGYPPGYPGNPGAPSVTTTVDVGQDGGQSIIRR